MADITTRAGKGSPLTHNEVDANFTNLNSDKYEAGDSPSFGSVTVTGTVDGRDVAADGSKLDGIESGADVTDTANVTAAGALMDSELTDIAAVKALDQGVATTDEPTFTNTQLAAIAESKGVTAADVFVYDTSKDSDGGAWRKRTQHTSWYNETLNTATRGSRREFPAVAVIVAESNKITIYNGDDPSLPMWMVFNQVQAENYFRLGGGIYPVTSISALDGILAVGFSGLSGYRNALTTVSFVADMGRNYSSVDSKVFNGPVSQRNTANSGLGITIPNTLIVSYVVNDVSMTVLPNAPIDPATGLPVPVIAVATAGGTSVIQDDGTVYDLTRTGGHNSVAIIDNEKIAVNRKSGGNDVYVHQLPLSADTNDFTGELIHYGSLGNINLTISTVGGGNLEQNAVSGSNGLAVTSPDYVTPNSSMFSKITSTYNTGWMNGDIKGAFLSDTDDTDLVGGTDNDRSVNANPLTVNGTVTRNPVATGADLVAYSGFSASNYLEQPYNSDLDFGTGDFCVMGWVKPDGGSFPYIIGRGTAQNSDEFSLYLDGDRHLNLRVSDSSGEVNGTQPISDNVWSHFVALRVSGVAYIYINGQVAGSEANTQTVASGSSALRIGKLAWGNPWSGSLALLRISATAPTAEQIAKIYNDEKHLFTEGSQATLYGASDAVTALAHDPVTDLLHVGTSAGRSVFSGLRRVDNTTTAVGTAISASNGLVAEE